MRKYGTTFDPAAIHFRALDKPFFSPAGILR